MPRSVGRPREVASPTGRGASADILAASARLFSTRGFSGTTTHAIAEAAGLRQPSIYHHFGGKKEILLALLTSTVRPSLQVVETALAAPAPAPARLWALCAADARLLGGGPDNLGELYLLPELSDPAFAAFHDLREQLVDGYVTLVRQCGYPDPDLGSWLVMGLIESIIRLRRRSPETLRSDTPVVYADAALRALGIEGDELRRARTTGSELLDGSHVST